MCKFRDFDKYEIYEDGRIWSYSRNKFLKPIKDQNGYQLVHLSDNEGKRKMYRLHRVVWESVTGSPILEGYEINHINEDKTSNFFANLELVSHKENINFGTRTEKASKSLTNNKKLSKQVGAFKDGKLILTFPSAKEAGRQGFNFGNVASCCRNCYMRPGNNIYKGFEWRYI